jgi:EpsI family protein
MITMPVLLLEMWVLNKIGTPVPVNAIRRGATDKKLEMVTGSSNDNRSLPKAFLEPVFIIAVALLSMSFILSNGMEFRENVPIKKSFDQFPLTIGDWTGERQFMEQQFVNALHFGDYIMINYRNPEGRQINFYTAYYKSQRKGEGTHSPETCLPGSGWTFEHSGLVSIDTGKGQVMRISRAFMTKGDERQLVYFWFPQRGRILTSLYQVKLYSFWDALIKKRTDGALVRVITPLAETEDLEKAEERLINFVKLVNPLIEQYVPQ